MAYSMLFFLGVWRRRHAAPTAYNSSFSPYNNTALALNGRQPTKGSCTTCDLDCCTAAENSYLDSYLKIEGELS